MILSAQSIRALAAIADKPLISPCLPGYIHKPTGLSGGLGPCSYDVTLAQDVRLDPTTRFTLASTVERFCLPENVAGHVRDKSSLRRSGLSVGNTHLDPGWEGYLTLELDLIGLDPLAYPKGTPIAQVIFELLDEPTDIPYTGRYNQQPPTPVAAR